MAITVTNASGDCQSQLEAHKEHPADAVIYLGIGSQSVALCLDCARKTFTLVGFMIMSNTGESLQSLVGMKKGRRS